MDEFFLLNFEIIEKDAEDETGEDFLVFKRDADNDDNAEAEADEAACEKEEPVRSRSVARGHSRPWTRRRRARRRMGKMASSAGSNA